MSTTDLKYGKLLDLFDLALEMQERSEGISLDEIAREYSCSKRTAVRMKDALLRGFPAMEEVYTGEKTKRWRIPQQQLNTLISFSSEELSVFDAAVNSFEKQGLFEKAKIMKSVALKLKNVINHKEKIKNEVDAEAIINSESVAFRPGPRIIVDRRMFETIRNAILSFNKIEIVYNKRGRICKIKVSPYGFLYGERNHYLLAKNRKGKFRAFILPEIKEVNVLPEQFEMDPNFNLKDYTKQSFGAFFETPFENEWVFNAKATKEAKKYIFHPDQETTENEDGTYTVKFKAGGLLEMSWFLRTWGKNVTVLKPVDFWKKAELAQKYFDEM